MTSTVLNTSKLYHFWMPFSCYSPHYCGSEGSIKGSIYRRPTNLAEDSEEWRRRLRSATGQVQPPSRETWTLNAQ